MVVESTKTLSGGHLGYRLIVTGAPHGRRESDPTVGYLTKEARIKERKKEHLGIVEIFKQCVTAEEVS
jgi:hypothetical protein